MPPVLGPTVVTDRYRVTFVQRLYGQRVLNVIWYQPTAIPDPAPDRWDAMGSLADAMTGAGKIQTRMAHAQSEDLTHEEIRVNVYNGDNVARYPFFALSAVLAGEVAVPAGTANVALSIEKRASFPAGHPRMGIGRFQLGGIPNDAYEEGLFTPAYLDLASGLRDELTAAIVTAGVTFQPVLVNFPEGGSSVEPIFGTSIKRTVRDMRRRTVGVGE